MKERHAYVFAGEKLRDFILGMMDGIVSTVGVVAGVSGATANNFIVFIAGISAALAEAVSMFFSAYISSKAEKDVFEREKMREEEEVRRIPEAERREIYKIFKAKGFKGKELEMIVKRITSKKRLWVKTMLIEELGIMPKTYSPLKNAALVFLGSVVGGLIPLTPFLIGLQPQFTFSVVISILILFIVGSGKSTITGKGLLRSGLESMIAGIIAIVIAYYIGLFLSLIFNIPRI